MSAKLKSRSGDLVMSVSVDFFEEPVVARTMTAKMDAKGGIWLRSLAPRAAILDTEWEICLMCFVDGLLIRSVGAMVVGCP